MKNKHKIYSYNIDQLIYTSKSLFFFIVMFCMLTSLIYLIGNIHTGL